MTVPEIPTWLLLATDRESSTAGKADSRRMGIGKNTHTNIKTVLFYSVILFSPFSAIRPRHQRGMFERSEHKEIEFARLGASDRE